MNQNIGQYIGSDKIIEFIGNISPVRPQESHQILLSLQGTSVSKSQYFMPTNLIKKKVANAYINHYNVHVYF